MTGRRLLPFERLALVMLALLLLGMLLHDPLYRAFWFAAGAAIAFLWLLAGLFALFGIVFAFSDQLGRGERLRVAAAMPSALLAAWLLAAPVFDAGRWLFAYAHLQRYRDTFEAEVRRKPPDRVIVFRYIEGVPDTGVSIIHSRRLPETFPAARSIRLLGEPIRACRRLRDEFHLCSHG